MSEMEAENLMAESARFRIFEVSPNGDYSERSTEELEYSLSVVLDGARKMRADGRFEAEARANERTAADIQAELERRGSKTPR